MRGISIGANSVVRLCILFFVCFFSSNAFAQNASLDAPHDPIGCNDCHDMTAFDLPNLIPINDFTPGPTIDDTLYNVTVCWKCHLDGDPVPGIQTHSSLQSSNKYGDWTVECVVCHNQHSQEQGSGYGKFIRDRIDRSKIIGVAKSGVRKVNFTGPVGSNSFADNNTIHDGICEVCHEQTDHWKENGLVAGQKHFSSLNCMDCHPHDQGMKPVPPDHDSFVPVPSFCLGCHGNTVFGTHYSSEAGWVNCNRCHDKDDNYALNGLLPLYLDDQLAAVPVKEKKMFIDENARCDDCHQGQYHEHITDTGHGRLHDNIILGYDSDNDGTGDQVLACDACHYPDAIQEHVTKRGYSCSVCHNRSEIGLPDVSAISDTVAAGRAGTRVFCDDCHDDDHFLTDAGTSLVKEHHYTSYSLSGNCRQCHVVGPGARGPQRAPCWYCHGDAKPRDPQRVAAGKHDQGPAFTGDTVDDFRVCFSCHLDGGQGYLSGITPTVLPLHGLPGTGPTYADVYWPYGYYRDASNNWVASDPLQPSDTIPMSDLPPNLEGDETRWLQYPGWRTLNYLGEKKKVPSSIYNDYAAPEVMDWARSGPNAIRSSVDIEFQKQNYPTVPIHFAGIDFEVPSFDGTGTIGQPAGTGNCSVTLEARNTEGAAVALPPDAQWRLDGGSWQDSGMTLNSISDRDEHLVEFKPVADWNEPEPVEITIVDTQTTFLSGASTTYTSCSSSMPLELTRDGGFSVFDWTSPEQVEYFSIRDTDSHIGPVECSLLQDNSGTLVAPTGFRVRTNSDGTGCVLDKDGFTPAGQYDLVLQAEGSSCFRNNNELPLTVNVTSAGEPSPAGQAGGIIGKPFMNSLGLQTGRGHDLLHLADNLYVHVNPNGVVSTFTADETGNLSSVIASADLWGSGASNGTIVKMAKVNDSLIALTYNIGPQGNAESHLMTVGIEQDGSIIQTKQDYLFHADYYSLRPMIFPHKDNNNLFIVTWVGYHNSPKITTTELMTVFISPSGMITELERNNALPNKGLNWRGNIVHVAGNKYAFAMAKDIRIIEVDPTGSITIPATPGSTYQYASDASYVEIIRVKGDVFAVVYVRGPSGIDAGVLETVQIDANGEISRTINSYMFDPCSAAYVDAPSITVVSDTIVGVSYYEYTSCDGQPGINLKTIEITDDGRIMVPPLDTLELAGGGNVTPELYHIGGDAYALLVHNDTSEGSLFSGVKSYSISHDNDSDGIASNTDNCDDTPNTGQSDADGDGVGDACDVCPGSDDTLDADADSIPDACDICAGHDDTVDSDGDGTPDGCDPCPSDPDNDSDNDGICTGPGFNGPMTGANDNCLFIANADQTDSDCDGNGDACGASIYFTPESPLTEGMTTGSVTVSWDDSMIGEDGYRIEGKEGACTDSAFDHEPLATVFRIDRFDNGLDTDGWVPGANVQTGSTTATPATVTDASGTSEVGWEDGKIKLHNIMNDVGDTGFNSSYISVKNFAGIVSDKDFDVQVDYELPNGAFSGDEYHVDVRLVFYFSQTDGKDNNFYIERRTNNYFAALRVNGVLERKSIPTTDLFGTLRLVRRNRELFAYYLDDNGWVLILKHSHQQTADLTPTWMGVAQYARRNESGGGELTALVDNFKFNTVGSVPVADLELSMDEQIWNGTAGEVLDQAPGNNNGTAYNGASTVIDVDRGTVGSFDGIDDYVEVSGSGTLENVTDESFTFAAWVKPASVPPASDNVNYTDHNYAIIARNGYHTELRYSRWQQFAFDTWNSDATPQSYVATSSATFAPGTWYHVAGVLDMSSKKVHLYVNGQSAAAPVDFVGIPREYGTIPYYVGMGRIDIGSTFYFDGQIEDVRIFDRALSAAEVDALYANRIEYTVQGLPPDTVYCTRVYPFKEDGCVNWVNHSAEDDGNTLTTTEGESTTAGAATAISLQGIDSLYVNIPYLNDTDGDNSYTVEYKLSSAGAWSTHVAGATHTVSPYATTISGLTLFEKYDVRVTYTDPDGVNGSAQQIIANVEIEPGISCLSILNNGGTDGDGVYWLDSDGDGPNPPYQAYCDMTTDGGGWTLAMKLDGSQSTFQYASSYWTTSNTLNTGSPGFDTSQAKLQSFNDISFTQVRAGMRIYTDPADDIDWITINQGADSLVSLFNSGYVATSVGRANWLNLLEGISTQDFCNKEGFNAEQEYSKMRIGFAMNQENDCSTCDRILGFGNQPTGHPWGDWAVVGGGYPGTNTVAYGWIMVR